MDAFRRRPLFVGAASELIADAVFEAVALIGWRIIRCKAEIPPDEPDQWY